MDLWTVSAETFSCDIVKVFRSEIPTISTSQMQYIQTSSNMQIQFRANNTPTFQEVPFPKVFIKVSVRFLEMVGSRSITRSWFDSVSSALNILNICSILFCFMTTSGKRELMILKIAEAQPPEHWAINSGTELAYIYIYKLYTNFSQPFLDEIHLPVRTQ